MLCPNFLNAKTFLVQPVYPVHLSINYNCKGFIVYARGVTATSNLRP
jgi:hypothetical protein